MFRSVVLSECGLAGGDARFENGLDVDVGDVLGESGLLGEAQIRHCVVGVDGPVGGEPPVGSECLDGFLYCVPVQSGRPGEVDVRVGVVLEEGEVKNPGGGWDVAVKLRVVCRNGSGQHECVFLG